MVEVVLPTPPFWLHIAITLAGPWLRSRGGAGKRGMGLPVGPSRNPLPGSTRPSATADSSSMGGTSSAGAGLVCALDLATDRLPPRRSAGDLSASSWRQITVTT